MIKLYLDVDGVINAWHADTEWPTLVVGDAHGYNVKWSPEMVAELKSLDLELIWATTWRQHAPEQLAPLIGYGENVRYLTERPKLSEYGSIGWKYRGVVNDQKWEPSPFVWIDDEHHRTTVDWAKANGGLAIQSHPDLGITPEEMERIKAYVEANS